MSDVAGEQSVIDHARHTCNQFRGPLESCSRQYYLPVHRDVVSIGLKKHIDGRRLEFLRLEAWQEGRSEHALPTCTLAS